MGTDFDVGQVRPVGKDLNKFNKAKGIQERQWVEEFGS